MRRRRTPTCHPDRKGYVRDLCAPCYNAIWRRKRTPAQRQRAKTLLRAWVLAHPERRRAINDKWRRNNPDWTRTQSSAHRRRLRDLVFAHYGMRCICCGETHPVFLSLDHVANDGAAHRRQLKPNSLAIYRWARDHGYPDTLQVLCFNCNWAKRFGLCPHQSVPQ